MYSDWVDACDAVAKGKNIDDADGMPMNDVGGAISGLRGGGLGKEAAEESLGPDFIEDDEGDMNEEYGVDDEDA